MGVKKTNQNLVNKKMNMKLDPKEKNCSFDKWQPNLGKRCLYLNNIIAKWPEMKAL